MLHKFKNELGISMGAALNILLSPFCGPIECAIKHEKQGFRFENSYSMSPDAYPFIRMRRNTDDSNGD
jgi:hypothetical protein